MIAQRDDTAVCAAGRGITAMETQSSMGKFMDFCPVMFKENNCLVKCHEGLEYAVEYRGQVFKTLNEECMKKFIASPGGFLDGVSLLAAPIRGRVPVPIPAGESVGANDLALEGHCPVTLWLDPKDRRCVIPGSHTLQVQYGDLIFRMANKTAHQNASITSSGATRCPSRPGLL